MPSSMDFLLRFSTSHLSTFESTIFPAQGPKMSEEFAPTVVLNVAPLSTANATHIELESTCRNTNINSC